MLRRYTFKSISLFLEKMNKMDTEKIDNLIYEIRGVKVMLESDFARFYMQTNDKNKLTRFYRTRRNVL